MTPARVSTAAVLAVAVAALVWAGLGLWTRSGGTYLPLPWTAVAGTAALAVAVVAAGLPVRRWVGGRRDRPLDPLVAARTVVLAKAAAYAGALLAGWYAAQGLVILPDLVGVRRTRFALAVAATLAAVAVSLAGFVVQRWCRVPPDDDERPGGDAGQA
ncbi:MAG: DUF3180 family protein [Kineosporiaceae bacterium]